MQSFETEPAKELRGHSLAALAMCAASVAFSSSILIINPVLSVRAAGVIAITISVTCLIAVGRTVEGGAWSLPQTCLIALTVFHTGAFIELLHTSRPAFFGGQMMAIMPETPRAALISCLGISCFSLGIVMARPGPKIDLESWNIYRRAGAADTGAILTLAAIAFWFNFALSSGLTVGSSYADYLKAVVGTSAPLYYYVLALGFPLAMLDYRRFLPKVAAVAFILFSLFAFPIGLRGEVLFSAAIAVCVVGFQRKLPGLGASVALFVALLIPIAVVSQTRQADSAASVSFDPLRGLYELGATQVVVNYVVQWHETQEEPFYSGATYIAPTRDTLGRFALGEKAYDPGNDRDYMATQVITRVGYIGGSIIAEAYNNFALRGVALIMSVLGLTIGRLSRRSTFGAGFMAVVFAVLFQQLVRNAFESAPIILILALVVWGFAWALGTIYRARGERTDIVT